MNKIWEIILIGFCVWAIAVNGLLLADAFGLI